MKRIYSYILTVALMAMTMFFCIGYASLTDPLYIEGSAEITPPQYDVHISKITPDVSGGVSINQYFKTVMSAKVKAAGTSRFTVTVVNRSDKTYVFERVIDGAEVNLDGIYNGTDITYELIGLTELQEIQPNGGSIAFDLIISNHKGVDTDYYFLNFNFIEKTGTEILPGTGEEEPQYEVIFEPGNGEGDTVLIVKDGELLPKPVDPVRDGYTFTGWYKDLSYVYAWNFENDKVTTNTTLYAGWTAEEEPPTPPVEPEEIQYEVVFVYNNGEADSVVVVNEGELLQKPADPTRSGYIFTGWYKDLGGTDPWNFESDLIDSNTTLYAGWRDSSAPPTNTTRIFWVLLRRCFPKITTV